MILNLIYPIMTAMIPTTPAIFHNKSQESESRNESWTAISTKSDRPKRMNTAADAEASFLYLVSAVKRMVAQIVPSAIQNTPSIKLNVVKFIPLEVYYVLKSCFDTEKLVMI